MKILHYKIILLLLSVISGTANAEERLVLSEISLDQAVKQVAKGKRLLGAETKYLGKRKVHVIKILTNNGRVRKHKIDAETGKRLSQSR